MFSYKGWEIRSRGNVISGNFPGWTKVDVTNNAQFNKYNLKNGKQGIKIEIKLTREQKWDEPGQINEGLVLEIDLSNNEGYQRAKDLITELQKTRLELLHTAL